MKIIITVEDDGKDVVTVDLNNCKEDIKVTESFSNYARYFDASCPAWNNDVDFNKIYLKHQEAFANECLKSRGHLFLNEVYDMLGFPRTKEGAVVGWVYNEHNSIGDNYVEFDLLNERNNDFINGYSNNVWLDFNVDGNILEYAFAYKGIDLA